MKRGIIKSTAFPARIYTINENGSLEELSYVARTSWEDRYLGRVVDAERFSKNFPYGQWQNEGLWYDESIVCRLEVGIDDDYRITSIGHTKYLDLTCGHGRPVTHEKRVTKADLEDFEEALEKVLVTPGENIAKENVRARRKYYAERNAFIDSVVEGRKKLCAAVKSGRLEKVKELKAYIPLKVDCPGMQDPLYIAAGKGDSEVFKYLVLEGGLMVSSPKHLCAKLYKKNFELMVWMLQLKGIPNFSQRAWDVLCDNRLDVGMLKLDWPMLRRIASIDGLSKSIRWSGDALGIAIANDLKLARRINDEGVPKSYDEKDGEDRVNDLCKKQKYDEAMKLIGALNLPVEGHDMGYHYIGHAYDGVRPAKIDAVGLNRFTRFCLERLDKNRGLRMDSYTANAIARYCESTTVAEAARSIGDEWLGYDSWLTNICDAFAENNHVEALRIVFGRKLALTRKPGDDNHGEFLAGWLQDQLSEILSEYKYCETKRERSRKVAKFDKRLCCAREALGDERFATSFHQTYDNWQISEYGGVERSVEWYMSGMKKYDPPKSDE